MLCEIQWSSEIRSFLEYILKLNIYFTAGYPNGAGNSLARSNASVYGGGKEDLYDRLRKHAYTGKKGEDE